MADRIAAFLFAYATIVLPITIAVCVAAIIWMVRRWPATILSRIGYAAGILAMLVVATAASALQYAERSIRRTVAHRVETLSFHPRGTSKAVHVADLRGHVVLLNFWATWCTPWRAEMPDLNRLVDAYRGQPVSIVAVTDETADRIAAFEQKSSPLKMTIGTFVSDEPKGRLASAAYSGRPTTVIVDREGRVREIFIGIQTYDTFRKSIDRHL